jgi:signal transduction histidine kinase
LFYGRIGRRLILSFVILVVVVIGGCGWFFYKLIYGQLDQQLDDHLVAVAQLVAEKFDGDVVLRLKPEYEIYRRLRLQLIDVCELVNAERIYVFDKDGRCLIDTGSGAVVGKPYPRLIFDQKEVGLVWRGLPSSSVRFQDAAGVDFQTGYAPIKSGSEAVVAAVGVEIGVGFVKALRMFARGAFLLAGGAAVVTLLAGLMLGKSVTEPIAKLVEAAQAIGRGELTKPVRPPSRDELGYLGQTLDEMRCGLLARDERLRQMLAGVAHEIRNPLGGIELHAGLIAMDLAPDDARRAQQPPPGGTCT